MSLPKNIADILAQLGLSVLMNTDRASEDYKNVNNLKDIQGYTPVWYKKNNALQETDEIYRFSTRVFLHSRSGIRCEYNIHESYFGDDEYKLHKVFVITLEKEMLDVLYVNFKEGYVLTEKEKISFNNLKLIIEPGD